jgi:hypothetical protein
MHTQAAEARALQQSREARIAHLEKESLLLSSEARRAAEKLTSEIRNLEQKNSELEIQNLSLRRAVEEASSKILQVRRGSLPVVARKYAGCMAAAAAAAQPFCRMRACATRCARPKICSPMLSARFVHQLNCRPNLLAQSPTGHRRHGPGAS